MKGCREIRRGSRKVHVCDGPSEALSEQMTSERLFCYLGVTIAAHRHWQSSKDLQLLTYVCNLKHIQKGVQSYFSFKLQLLILCYQIICTHKWGSFNEQLCHTFLEPVSTSFPAGIPQSHGNLLYSSSGYFFSSLHMTKQNHFLHNRQQGEEANNHN